MALRSCADTSPDSSTETQLGLPAPLRNMVETNEDNVVHSDVQRTDSPSPIGPYLHCLLAHRIHELLDASCDDFSKFLLADHAAFMCPIFRLDLFVARFVAWPLGDHQSRKEKYEQ